MKVASSGVMTSGGAMAMPSLRAADDQAALAGGGLELAAHVEGRVEFLLGRLVRDDLDEDHQPLAAHVADVRVVVEAVARASSS